MVTTSRVSYPQRHLGRYLRPLVEAMKGSLPRKEQKIEGVADAIGVDRTALHHYMAGRRLPRAEEQDKLALLPGADAEVIANLIVQDKLAAFAIDHDQDPEQLLRKARNVAEADGLTLAQLDEILSDVDPEAIERHLKRRRNLSDTRPGDQ